MLKSNEMPVYRFPDPLNLEDDEIVGLGNDLSVENLVSAYGQGIFPWPVEDLNSIPWFCPESRGIIEFKNFKIPSRFLRELKKSKVKCTIDKNFKFVIENCAKVKRSHQDSTWISQEMIAGYINLHKAGFAHSIEVWENEKIIGGMYGVCVEGVFAGESMFSLKTNASKYALVFLVEYLKARGAHWFDTQMVTPLTASFGAHEISRKQFLKKLKATQQLSLKLF